MRPDVLERHSKWLGLALATGLFALWFPCSSHGQTTTAPAPAPRRPNILFILADDLGWGDLGCYGQKKIQTPNLDKLAEEGMRFTSFYAGSTVCAPSRAALMLGQHTGHLRIRGNSRGLSLQPDEVTVAEVLKQAGYHTGAIGKWGLAEPDSPGVPQKKGFDEWLGYLDNLHAHNYYPDYLWRYDPPGSTSPGFDGKLPLTQNQGGGKGQYVPDLCTTAALNFVRNNRRDPWEKYRPFFLFLCYTIPHANNELGSETGNGMEVPSDTPYGRESWPQPEKNKAAMITRMDADIGRLMARLKELKLDDNTIIFFTSDNGPHQEGGVNPKFFESSGPFRGLKRDLTEGGIRVPMLARWPGRINAGTTSDQVWAFWDVLPTLAAIADARPPATIDGISMLPTLLGQPQTNQPAFLYWEFHERGFSQAARKGDWKAIRSGGDGPLELYNLKTDPGEKADVTDKNPDVVARLEECLKAARTESAQWPVKKAGRSGQKATTRSKP
jgi:arylsulfatase A-like enzyme